MPEEEVETKTSEVKGSEKLLTRLNHRCPELRGAANPNRAHNYCTFTVPSRRSSNAGAQDLGWTLIDS